MQFVVNQAQLLLPCKTFNRALLGQEPIANPRSTELVAVKARLFASGIPFARG